MFSAALSAAGFEFGGLASIPPDGAHFRTIDPNAVGDVAQVYRKFPYKVVDSDGKVLNRATGWLISVVGLTLVGKHGDSEHLVRSIKAEIERSIPLEPIQLNIEGDFLCERPPDYATSFLVDHVHDEDPLTENVGVHGAYCGGLMNYIKTTKTYSVIVCGRCHLRVLFHKDHSTYGSLRKFVE